LHKRRKSANGLPSLAVPISAGIIVISILLAFVRSRIFSSVFALLWAFISFPFNIATAWVLTKSGLYTLSREMTVRANTIKDREAYKTGTMMANTLRANVKWRGMKKIMTRPTTDAQEPGTEGARTPRVGGAALVSRVGTPMLGGTPMLNAAEFDDDVEKGVSSRRTNQVRLVR
jgi:hypothetical protein